MIIQILENRKVHTFKDNNAGTNGEHNATILNFIFPLKIAGIEISKLKKYIHFDIPKTGLQPIEDDQYLVSKALTQNDCLKCQVYIKKSDNSLVFKSEIFELNFLDALHRGGDDPEGGDVNNLIEDITLQDIFDSIETTDGLNNSKTKEKMTISGIELQTEEISNLELDSLIKQTFNN